MNVSRETATVIEPSNEWTTVLPSRRTAPVCTIELDSLVSSTERLEFTGWVAGGGTRWVKTRPAPARA